MMKGSPLYSPKEKDTQCKCNTIKNLKKERAKPLFRKKDKQNVQVLHFDQQWNNIKPNYCFCTNSDYNLMENINTSKTKLSGNHNRIT